MNCVNLVELSKHAFKFATVGLYCATNNEAICEQKCDESGLFGSRVVVTSSEAVKFDLNQQSLINKRSMTSRLKILKPLYLVKAQQLVVWQGYLAFASPLVVGECRKYSQPENKHKNTERRLNLTLRLKYKK